MKQINNYSTIRDQLKEQLFSRQKGLSLEKRQRFVKARTFSEVEEQKQNQEVKQTEVGKNIFRINQQMDDFNKHYILGDFIGEGGHATVRKCFKITNPSIVYAVKIFRADDPEIINTIKETFKIGRMLNESPHSIGVEELFIDEINKVIYQVMEYQDFPTLEQLIHPKTKLRRLDPIQIRDIMIHLSRGVQFMHEKGICHRDLKPDNILVQRLGSQINAVKIIDFNVSKIFIKKSIKQDMWTRTGTIFYQAPEMFVEGGYTSKVNEQLINGHQMLCNRLPFQSEYVVDTIELICEKSNQFTQDLKFQQLDHLQQDLIRRLLQKDSDKRLDATEMILHPWLGGQTENSSKQQIKDDLILSQKPEEYPVTRAFSTQIFDYNEEHQITNKNNLQRVDESENEGRSPYVQRAHEKLSLKSNIHVMQQQKKEEQSQFQDYHI